MAWVHPHIAYGRKEFVFSYPPLALHTFRDLIPLAYRLY